MVAIENWDGSKNDHLVSVISVYISIILLKHAAYIQLALAQQRAKTALEAASQLGAVLDLVDPGAVM